jgi:ribosome-binding factor A
MDATRRARLAAVIQQELSVAVRELKDPRIPTITFTAVEVTQDGSQATAFISVLGGLPEGNEGREQMEDCLAGLASASGFLRRHLARVLTVRHIPTLIFKEDKGLDNAARVYDLLKKI